MTIGITGKGDYSKTKHFLNRLLHGEEFANLDIYGRMGVRALAGATPVDTGLTASSWDYRIIKERHGMRVEWFNTHGDEANRTSVAILIQYGHGTGTGGYVQGRDYINPAIQPLFDMMADEIWKVVIKP
jgi:hypothetical protein